MPPYAVPTDLRTHGLPAAALAGFTNAELEGAIAAASREADGYLVTRFRLPLTTWGDDLRAHVCAMAAYRLMSVRGFNPEAGDNTELRLRKQDAVTWLERIARGTVLPTGISDSKPANNTPEPTDKTYVVNGTPSEDGETYVVGTPTRRGW